MHTRNAWETHQMRMKMGCAHEKHMGNTSDVREMAVHMKSAWETHQMCMKRPLAHEKHTEKWRAHEMCMEYTFYVLKFTHTHEKCMEKRTIEKTVLF